MLMPVLFWVIVATTLSGIGFAAWKLANKVDKEEQELLAWQNYIENLRLIDPQRAQYLEWIKETGQEHLYYSLMAQQNQQNQQQEYRQW